LTLRRAWLLSHVMFAVCMLLTFFVRGVFMATLLVGLVGLPWAITCWAPFALIASEISKRDAIRRGLIQAPPTLDGQILAANEDDSADQAGVVLGIHNVAVSAPQVIATLISSAIFKWLSKPRGTPGDESVAWCMRFGGICALVAAWLTMRVGEDKEGLVAGGQDVRSGEDWRSGEDGRRLLSQSET
jgi:solute carrier family 45 protein 1/2/4